MRAAEVAVVFEFKFGSPVQNVRKVEVYDIVANDEIRVVTQHQFLEKHEQLPLIFSLLDLNSRNR